MSRKSVNKSLLAMNQVIHGEFLMTRVTEGDKKYFNTVISCDTNLTYRDIVSMLKDMEIQWRRECNER